MPGPDGSVPADLGLDPTEAELEEQIAGAGFQLTAIEQANVLAIARYLRGSVALVRFYNGSAADPNP